jgi:hypothetical protein
LLIARKVLARRRDLNQNLGMPKLIAAPTRVAAAGTKPKIIVAACLPAFSPQTVHRDT